LREAMAEELKGRVVGGEGKEAEIDELTENCDKVLDSTEAI